VSGWCSDEEESPSPRRDRKPFAAMASSTCRSEYLPVVARTNCLLDQPPYRRIDLHLGVAPLLSVEVAERRTAGEFAPGPLHIDDPLGHLPPLRSIAIWDGLRDGDILVEKRFHRRRLSIGEYERT
jgi:hypothetical protein